MAKLLLLTTLLLLGCKSTPDSRRAVQILSTPAPVQESPLIRAAQDEDQFIQILRHP